MGKITSKRADQVIFGHKKIVNAYEIHELDQYYLQSNSFDIEQEIVVDVINETRRFYLSTDNRFYFSPTLTDQVFQIYNCDQIRKVSVFGADAGTDAVAGAVMLGVAGVIAGSNNKRGKVEIRVEFKDDYNPIQYFVVNPGKILKSAPQYRETVRRAEIICHILENRITADNTESIEMSKENNDFISQLERLGTLKEKGLITEDEWVQAKRKLLS